MPAVAVTALLLAAAGHLASAAITLAGRWKGGIIIPMFFTGYCLGRAMAEWSGHDGYYLVLATSMMVACNAGMTKTPLGSALVVSEMTAVTLMPPLVIAALVSLCLTSRVTFVGGQRHRDHPPPRAPGSATPPTPPAQPRPARRRPAAGPATRLQQQQEPASTAPGSGSVSLPAAHWPLRSPPRPEALSLQAAGQTLALSIADGVIAIISVIGAATVKIHGNHQQIRRLGTGHERIHSELLTQ